MLNHATMKVMEAEKQKTDSEAEQLQPAAFYTAAEQACQRLEKRLFLQPFFQLFAGLLCSCVKWGSLQMFSLDISFLFLSLLHHIGEK